MVSGTHTIPISLGIRKWEWVVWVPSMGPAYLTLAHMSNEKKTWLGQDFIGDEILSSYIAIIS